MYLQNLHELGDTQWNIIAGNLRSDMQSTIDAMRSQGYEYTLETISPSGVHEYQTIKSIKSIIDWDSKLNGLTAIAADENTKIISFTVTEAGYYLDENNQLDDSFDDLRSDLEGKTVSTIYGAITKFLRARMEANGKPVTLLNCDNVRSNGSLFRASLLDFIHRINDQELQEWVKKNTSCPNSMVDRITPRPTPDVIERVRIATGKSDEAALMGESFSQWVIEDNFIAGRPAWERVDVSLVDDVEPFEEAKIRMLNGTHSCIAWAGTLRGYDFIHEGLQDPEVRKLAFDYVTDDVIPCLNNPDHASPMNLPEYRDVVLDRFSNPNIQDTNQRVAMDAYSKIPSFILPTISDALKANRSIDSVAVLPALFLEFLMRQQRGEISYKYEDQVMDAENAKAIVSAEDPVATFANDKILFKEFAGNPELTSALRKAYLRVTSLINSTV
ncbi:UNVERIFIED_CONTAM: hypothetical protein GTU68_022346 [Idotea baltica]|nr:hypothetical protein [Idotea baltica]